jgi:butyrate kinase
MKAAARKAAENIGLEYNDANIVVAHLGGGITISLHEQGRMSDILSDDEGPFSPEGSGRVPCRKLIELCYSGLYDRQEMLRKLRGRGGLTAYAGTNDVEELERRVSEGDENARLWLEAMAYQVAKGIGEMAVAASGDVDMIVLTGGMAGSERIFGWIERRVAFIADVLAIPGEMEMESLAAGVFRVLKGVEKAYEYR